MRELHSLCMIATLTLPVDREENAMIFCKL